MGIPDIEGLNILDLLDDGGCGRVYRVDDGQGGFQALKVLDDLCVSRGLLGKMYQRLCVDQWADGVMPVTAAKFDRRTAYLLLPWMADLNDDGTWVPRSLQHGEMGLSTERAWGIIIGLARALSQMHQRHVAHGNLKPGNVFLDHSGKVLVSDWCLGNMPGVHVFHFTDALLYQPPEQLLNPAGYHDEAGYGWDVYAFGVIAYRLLTGYFPRCHEAFQHVVPPQGVTRHDGIKADPVKIAANLQACALADWLVDSGNPFEAKLRVWIEQCLAIDPAQRPASMMEVCAGLELIEKEVAAQNEHKRLVQLRLIAGRRSKVWFGLFMAVLLGALVLAGLWRRAVQRLDLEMAQIVAERQALKVAMTDSLAAQAMANERAALAEQSLKDERSRYLAELEASRSVGDELFKWVMSAGSRQLPPLDANNLQLKRLERYFQEFIKNSQGNVVLESEHARAHLQLWEIAIAQGEVVEAGRRYADFQRAWASRVMDAETRLRVATDLFGVAILMENKSDVHSGEGFVAARQAFQAVDRSKVDADRVDQLLAMIDFHEAKHMATAGEEPKALEYLMRATKTLNRLSEQRPDTAILRSVLADCYLSSAVILDGMGNVGDAREVRQLGAEELVRMNKAHPDDLAIQFDLAECYSAMAEAAILSGDMEAAQSRSDQALKLLNVYLVSRPRDSDATVKKAAQLGFLAGIQRDKGMSDESNKSFNEALRLLDVVHEREPEHSMASYRLAWIWWQKARLTGVGDNASGDIVLMRQAAKLLDDIGKQSARLAPSSEQLLRTRAYLAGDLGHALQQAKEKKGALEVFTEAVGYWKMLHDMRPHSVEYSDALEWCEQRMNDLK